MQRTTIFAILVFIIALLAYRSNDGFLDTYDSAPTSLFVMNAIEHHTFDFDDFRGGNIDIRPGYPLIETPDGHLQSLFPIGTAILTAPLYCLLELQRIGHPEPDITTDAFILLRLQDEKFVANFVAAAADVLFFLCAIRISTLLPTLISTIAFALGSEMWTIASQSLWQHGAVALVTLAMTLALLRSIDGQRPAYESILAGMCAGFLPVIRPTALVFSLVGIVFTLRYKRKQSVLFALGFVIGLLPGIVWNVSIFHTIVGGYEVNETSYSLSWTQAATAMAGLLVSPNRGVFVFTPFVFFSLIGAALVWRDHTEKARLIQFLTIASAALFGNYLVFQRWQGGSTFGPRYLTELMPAACLLLLFVLPRDLRSASRIRRTSFGIICVAIALSTGVQMAGANGEPKTNWSGVPIDLSLAPDRVWQWHDSQIERDALATFHLRAPNPTFPNAYAIGFDGRILAIYANGALVGPAGITAKAKSTIRISVRLENTGSSRWYGYDTGMYYGLAHVRLRYLTNTGVIAMERYLSIPGTPGNGERPTAVADVDVPASPGMYEAVFDIDAYQDARIGSRQVGARSVRFVVSP